MTLRKNDNEKAVYDGRQLALKISANSIYGFTGGVLFLAIFREKFIIYIELLVFNFVSENFRSSKLPNQKTNSDISKTFLLFYQQTAVYILVFGDII